MLLRQLPPCPRAPVVPAAALPCPGSPQEKFTRFATIATAITGQAFVPAAKAVFDTLKRNFLQTYSLWCGRPGLLAGGRRRGRPRL